MRRPESYAIVMTVLGVLLALGVLAGVVAFLTRNAGYDLEVFDSTGQGRLVPRP